MMTQSRTALAASILLGLTGVYLIAQQVYVLTRVTGFRAVYPAQLLGNICLLLPLPLLFFIVYRSGTTLLLPPNLRIVALGAAFFLGIVSTAPRLYDLTAMLIREWSGLGWLDQSAVAPRLWQWLISRPPRDLFRGFVIQLSQIAVALFLVALVRDLRNAAEGNERGARLVKRVALVAAGAAGVVLVLSVVQQVRAFRYAEQMMFVGRSTRMRFLIHDAVSELVSVSRLLVPLLIYWSLRPTSQAEPTGVR